MVKRLFAKISIFMLDRTRSYSFWRYQSPANSTYRDSRHIKGFSSSIGFIDSCRYNEIPISKGFMTRFKVLNVNPVFCIMEFFVNSGLLSTTRKTFLNRHPNLEYKTAYPAFRHLIFPLFYSIILSFFRKFKFTSINRMVIIRNFRIFYIS